MHTSASQATEVFIPSFAKNLCRLARQHGIRTSLGIDQYFSEDPAPRVVAKWTGSISQLRSLKLVAPGFNYYTKDEKHVIVPTSAHFGHTCDQPILDGYIKVSGEKFTLDADFGPTPLSISTINGVEVVMYLERTLYHGAAEAIAALGVCPIGHLPRGRPGAGRRQSGYGGGDRRRWAARKQPDGSVVFWLEEVAAWHLREQETAERMRRLRDCEEPEPEAPKPLLRVVVDNTRH